MSELEREKTHDNETKSLDLSHRSRIELLRWKATAASFMVKLKTSIKCIFL